MAGLRCGMRDGFFGVALVIVGYIMLSHVMSPQQARGEAPGCANNMCKEIKYYFSCAGAGTGISQETLSCLSCTKLPNGPDKKNTDGRCDSGTGDTCTPTDKKNRLAFNVQVNKVCDCQPNWNVLGGTVEATGNYTGTYSSDPADPQIYMCKKPS